MIIIGEKINGAIPSVKQAIIDRDAELIRNILYAGVWSRFYQKQSATETVAKKT